MREIFEREGNSIFRDLRVIRDIGITDMKIVR